MVAYALVDAQWLFSSVSSHNFCKFFLFLPFPDLEKINSAHYTKHVYDKLVIWFSKLQH